MLSWPVESGHPCLACSEDNFWDKGSFYAHEPTILPPSWGLGIQATADRVGLLLALWVPLWLFTPLQAPSLAPSQKKSTRTWE